MAKSKNTPKDHVLSGKELAAYQFEPWQHAPDERPPPSQEEWAKMAGTHLATLHIAWGVMFKTKPELMEAAERIPNAVGMDLFNAFKSATTFCECMLALLHGAETRIIVAGSAAELQHAEGKTQ